MRRLVISPWSWAVVLLAAATALVSIDPRVELPAFLLILAGGWACGFGFVNLTMRLRRPIGAGVHLLGAVGAALLLWASASVGPLPADVPPVAAACLMVARLAAAPAAGWVWLGLIGRITTRISSRSPAASPPQPPAWRNTERRSEVRFRAVPMRMRALGSMVAAVVIVVGALTASLLIATGDLAERLGARVVVIVVGVLLALPAYLLLRAFLRRRTVACSISFELDRNRDEDRVVVIAGDDSVDITLAEVDLLLWRTEGDYARVELHSARIPPVSLLVGMAATPAGVAAALPELPPHIRGRLDDAGLAREHSKRSVTTFRRVH